MAREKHQGKEEDAIVSRLKARDNEARTALTREEDAAKDEAWKIFANTKSLSKIPVSVLARMNGKDRVGIEDYARRLVNAGGDETRLKTDVNDLLALTNMMGRDPQAFVDADLRNYRLSDADMKQFALKQVDYRQKGVNSPEVIRTQNEEQMISDRANRLFPRPRDAAKKANYIVEAHKHVALAGNDLGRRLSQEETRKYLDTLEISNGKKYYYEAITTGEKFVPKYSKQEIRLAMDEIDRFKLDTQKRSKRDLEERAVNFLMCGTA
jgi:hypothetical protein